MAFRRPLLSMTTQCVRAPARRACPFSQPAALRICSSQRSRSSLLSPLRLIVASNPSRRTISTTPSRPKISDPQQPPPGSSKIYSFEDVQSLVTSPDPNRIIIDVREPSELTTTGTIPTSLNIPVTSSPDALFLPAEEFEDRFGFPKPDPAKELVFFCKAGVRSRAAAGLARDAGYAATGEFPGSWIEWSEKGGEAESVKRGS